ncbi:hypothetical protein GMSM_20330 [Geomonas sp. Red276]
MKKSSIVSALVLIMAALTLSGCIWPYWGYEGGGGRGGGYHDEGHHDGGHRDGGGRR